MKHRDKFSSGLKVAPVLNLARSAKNLLLFAILHHFCQYFDSFEIKIGATDISALSNNTKAPKKWQKDKIRAKRSKCLAPG